MPTIRDHLDDPVTTHMRRAFTQLPATQTVGEALASLREKPPAERIIYFYVADADGRLLGVLPTRRLLLSPLDTPLSAIMVGPVVAIPDSATLLEACEFFTMHRLLAFPVVDAERRLAGVVDVELYTDELSSIETHESNDSLFQLVGVHVESARKGSAAKLFAGRFPWLLCNIAGGLLAAVLSHVFRAELAWEDAVLALFVPVVLALAESVSIQSVSLGLSALQGQTPTWGLLGGNMRRESLTGLMLGAACGGLVALVALAWIGKPVVALCLLGGIGFGVLGAALIGFSMPMVLRLLQRDPRLAAGPIALALADMLTLTLYFSLARALLSG